MFPAEPAFARGSAARLPERPPDLDDLRIAVVGCGDLLAEATGDEACGLPAAIDTG
jgi:hypothetical protein